MLSEGLKTLLFTYGTLILNGIIIITIHGFLTALTSYLLGDDIPKRNGMVTLNPLKHIEPIGYILYIVFGFGWGQPVRTSSYGYKNKRVGAVLTALIPIIIGLAYGFGIMFVNPIIFKMTGNTYIYAFLYALGHNAMAYAIYNIIPVYPLNGHKLLTAVLSPNNVMKYNQMEKILQYILVFLILFGAVGRVINIILLPLNGIIA